VKIKALNELKKKLIRKQVVKNKKQQFKNELKDALHHYEK
jgi:hypothetical protein